MELRDLYDKEWNHYEKNRFLNDDTKMSTESFDPEAFKHDGFRDRETYLETYVPALADDERLEQELNNFTPPRLGDMNGSPYQALVLRYGILLTLIRQQDYYMEHDDLLEEVRSWQENVIGGYEEGDFPNNDNLLHLAQAASEYHNDIDDSELHLIDQYLQVRNEATRWKHQKQTWRDFFHRLSSIDRFPKVTRTEKPAHAIDTIEKGLWSLQEQAITYEVVQQEGDNLVGIPEDYADFIKDWLGFEMSDDNYLTMLEELEPFDYRPTLIEAREVFEVDTSTQGLNEKRRESLVEAGIYPSDLMREIVDKEDLKSIVDVYGLDAHKLKTDEMIEATITYFEQSQADIQEGEPTVDLYLDCFEDIGDGTVDHIPPQLMNTVEDGSHSEKLEVLFEQATAEIFREIFNLEATNLLGQTSSGTVADGEIEQDGAWLLWDNKRRVREFKLGASTRATIKSYIDTKNEQHDVRWFLIIAPEFSDQAADQAEKLEIQTGVDIRLITTEDFVRLAKIWRSGYGSDDHALPLSIFKGAGELNMDVVKETLDAQFS